jgi:putative endonuclease
MALHNQLGKDGEKLAEQYLVDRGYEIMYKNWRFSHYEIDIIAHRKDMLHIIEVKTLHKTPVSYPEDAVTKKKFRSLLSATDEFLNQHPEHRHVQYDILAITVLEDHQPEFFLLEDIYL